MLKAKDILYAKKRAKTWKNLGFHVDYQIKLNKTHSLKCNCSMCKRITYEKRIENRRNRYAQKRTTREELND